MATVLFLGSAPVARAQRITASDVEQYVRAEGAAFNSHDLTRIVEIDGLGGFGFGYRTTAPRTLLSKEDSLAQIRNFFSSVERYRITEEEMGMSRSMLKFAGGSGDIITPIGVSVLDG
jgi:hypothetical protein